MDTPVKHDGVSVKVGDRVLVVPDLNLRATRKLFEQGQMEVLSSLQGMPSPEQYEVLESVVVAALQRNYPEIDAAWLEDNCNLPQILMLLAAVMEATGLISSGESPQTQSP